MFRFEHPEHLILLVIVPIWMVLSYLYKKYQYKQRTKIGDAILVERMMEGHSTRRSWMKLMLIGLGLLFLVFSLSNPQWGLKRKKVKAKGADIMIAMDISLSMMSEDIPPNRLERAKKITEKLIDELKGERIGLILFAGNAYLQMPLTNDYAAAKLFVRSASTNQASSQGTAIGDAIFLAEKLFSEKEKYHRAMIIISDGENHDDEAIEIATSANERGLTIFTVGVGTTQGGFIPTNHGGSETFVRDRSGKFVKSKINEQLLSEVADRADGSYFHVSQYKSLITALHKKIAQLDRRELEQASFDEYNSYFQYFLILSLLFLMMGMWLPERSMKGEEK